MRGVVQESPAAVPAWSIQPVAWNTSRSQLASETPREQEGQGMLALLKEKASLVGSRTTGGLPMQFKYERSRRDGTAHRQPALHSSDHNAAPEEKGLNCACDQLLAVGDKAGQSDLFTDFRNIDSISARMLGTLIRLRQKLLAKGRRMTVANLRPQIYEVFVVARLDRILDLRLVGKPGSSPNGNHLVLVLGQEL
jgi:hypothetical protein